MSTVMNLHDSTQNESGTAQATQLLIKQREAAAKERIPSLSTRLDRLDRLRKLALSNQARFTKAVSEDFGGRAVIETELLELVPVAQAIRHAKKHLRKWMRPHRRGVDMTFWPSKAEVRYEPKGIVGIISPWNYPVALALSPLCDALAAGNRAILKPSELTPATSDLMAELIGEYFDESEVAVVTGGPEVAAHFSTLPFDHIFFTGSTSIGQKVAKAAAENLVPTTLELGGKSPAILCKDYPLAKAAKSLSFGKFINAGQTCIAPDYVLVPRGQAMAVASAILDQVKTAYPDLSHEHYSAIVSDRHLARLEALVSEAETSGATVQRAGDVSAGKLAPTIITNLPEDSGLMKEEIFGPVLPILEYDTIEHALEMVNTQQRPLALYCFTNDRTARETVLGSAISGGVTLNGTIAHIAQENLPFGGVGPSGWGAYHGEEGFKELSHARAVFQVRGLNSIELFGPPWGKFAERMTNFLMKR